MSPSARQDMMLQLADPNMLEVDGQLYRTRCSRSTLAAELQRVNSANRVRLSRKVIYELLRYFTPDQILQHRQSAQIGTRPSADGSPAEVNSGERFLSFEDSGERFLSFEDSGERFLSFVTATPTPKKRTKQQEFPGIDWNDTLNPDIQLCQLLYNERVRTYHLMQTMLSEKQTGAAASTTESFSELDDSNRLAHSELEAYQQTSHFLLRHPITVQFTADARRTAELIKLRADDAAAFTKKIANAEQNVRRYESLLRRERYDNEEDRQRLERNLTNAKRLLTLLRSIV